MRTFNRRFATALVAVLLVASACGAGSDPAEEGVASLAVDAGPSIGEAAGTDSPAELDADEAALEFSECMRAEGVDFPDIAVDAEGRLDLRSGFDEMDRGSDDFLAAMEVCRPLIEQVGFGAGGRAAIGENVEIQDALVEFSACVRDAGYDVGDLELGVPGQGQGQGGGEGETLPAGGRGQGQGQDGFGDRSARFAEQLGLDYEDPEVAIVIDDCMTVVDEAFSAAGVGRS